jgi:hypothetical protein
MVEIKSESQAEAHGARNFFRPGGAEIALYFLLSIVILLIYNSGSIIQKLGSNYIGSPENLKTNFTTLSSGFSNSFSMALGGRLGQIILWSFVGAWAYIALCLAKNVLNSFENDLISAHYLHPSTYSRAGYWGSSFSAKIFLAAMLLISAGFLFVAVRAVLPSVAALAGSAVYNFNWSTSPYYLVFSVIGGALVVYIAVVLLRLVSHLWKLL